jgi:hypothetical protein
MFLPEKVQLQAFPDDDIANPILRLPAAVHSLFVEFLFYAGL